MFPLEVMCDSACIAPLALMSPATVRVFCGVIVPIPMLPDPLINIISILLISLGWSVHKKQSDPGKKFLRIILFYGLGLLLVLMRIPWNNLPQNTHQP